MEARLPFIADDVEALFDNDLATITEEWMQDNLNKLQRRRT
jgi:hypothetical protein